MQSARTSRRQPGQRRAPADVAVSFRCPHCDGDHPAVECAAPVVQRLSAIELRRLRGRVCAEIADCYCNGADDEHLRALSVLLRAIDSRLDRRADAPAATLARRVQLAVERS